MSFDFKRKITFVCTLILISLTSFITAQNAAGASRQTAVRYLKLAEQYASQKQWKEADSNAAVGLSYDESIADLWYIRAVSQSSTGRSRAKVIPLIVKALTEGQWVDYNRDSARILYADILCATRNFDQALTVLDMNPFIFSADAEYIRAKSYYNLPDEQGITRAREKIDACRRIYPNDTRFPELFFRFEYQLGGRNPQNARIADAFITVINQYKNLDPQIEMFASIFAEGERQVRMLKSFNARGLKSPLYPAAALRNNLLDEHGALDYFYSFADNSIDINVFKDFASLLKDENSILEFGEYLNAYSGKIYIDTDNDLTYNLSVDYKRGRPELITYDENQDDQYEWTAECDFGVPEILHLAEGSIDLEYVNWPSIQRAFYKNEVNATNLTFNLVAETLNWSPFSIEADKDLNQKFGTEFFIPHVLSQTKGVSGQDLLLACSSYELPSSERKNAVIRVSVLNGVAQMARYFVNDVMYAQALFNGGIPVVRTVDMDGDGLFETVESYGYCEGREQNYISKKDEMQIMTNLFGAPASGTSFYVKMIQIDQNGDTVPDFTEEYLENEGKISSWDFNNDGEWETRYVRYPLQKDKKLIEEAQFKEPFKKTLIAVRSENGIPVSVHEDNSVSSIINTPSTNVYWIGKTGSVKDAKKVENMINLNGSQGVCIVVENESRRMLAVQIARNIFVKILPEVQVIEEKVENENF